MIVLNARLCHRKELYDIIVEEGVIKSLEPTNSSVPGYSPGDSGTRGDTGQNSSSFPNDLKSGPQTPPHMVTSSTGHHLNRRGEPARGKPGRTPGGDDIVIDAAGSLVSPPFVEPHVHLDAVLMSTYIRPNRSGTLLEGIDIWGECKRKADLDTYKAHAKKVIEWYVARGTQIIRSHVDTTAPGMENIEAILDIREDMRDLVDIQLVAFPQDGIYTYPAGESDMRKAMEMGCDVVGGIPHNELTREDGVRDVEFAFRLADEFGSNGSTALIDIHCDETGDPHSRFVEVMAKETILRENGDRVCASHVTAMHNYDNDYAFKLIGIIKRSGLTVITNPFDNTFLMNRNDGYPRRRGHTRVDELHTRGVSVAIGHDSVMDPWYPLGSASMLQAASLLLHTAHMTSTEQIEALFDMITAAGARALGFSDRYGIAAGKPANFLILDCSSVFEAIRLMPDPVFVIRNGSIISESIPQRYRLRAGSRSSRPDKIEREISLRC